MSHPHALVVPFPLQGHIGPLMQLAQHLAASHGILVTFVNTHHNHARIMRARKLAEAQESSSSSFDLSFPGIKMVSVSDGLPLEDERTLNSLGRSVALHMPPLVEQLISEINQTSSPITCIIADTFMPGVNQIVERANIPAAFAYFVSSIAQFSILCHVPFLISSGQLTPHGFPKQFEDKVQGLPGLPDMQITSLPWLVEDLAESEQLFNILTSMCEDAKKLDGILINSYYELENEAMDSLLQKDIKIMPSGPFVLLDSTQNTSYNVNSSVLLAEDNGCLDWLQGKPKCSVLYIAFGSIGQINIEELHELALGIEASQHTFLWVLRDDLMKGGTSACLPEGFLERTKDRAYFTTWAPQALVLSHPSIGAFLTHCGWNSVMEAISMGVPMLTWPYFADHKGICHQIVQEWKVGMPLIKSNNKQMVQQEVEKIIRSILSGNEGEKVRERAKNLKDKAMLSTKRDIGISYGNLQVIIKHIKLKAGCT